MWSHRNVSALRLRRALPTPSGKTLGQPSDETYDRIVFTYNVDGTLATRTDQNGTVLTWSYDSLRRKTEEEVTTVGSYTGGAAAPDSVVRSLTWTYDSEGRVQYLTSHTDTTPDTSTWTDAANQVKYTYNAADKLTKEEQEEDGAVDGSTLAVEYGYGTDYASAYYHRVNYLEYPDNRKIWNGYTHSGTTGTLQDTINDVFNRVGQIAKDNSGAIGNVLAEYDLNGMGRFVRRVHDEDSGKYGNDTRSDLWHGTTGDYDGLDRFGRIVDYKFTNFAGTAYDFERRHVRPLQQYRQRQIRPWTRHGRFAARRTGHGVASRAGDLGIRDAMSRPSLTPGIVGLAVASIVSGELLVQETTRGGEAIIQGFCN